MVTFFRRRFSWQQINAGRKHTISGRIKRQSAQSFTNTLLTVRCFFQSLPSKMSVAVLLLSCSAKPIINPSTPRM